MSGGSGAISSLQHFQRLIALSYLANPAQVLSFAYRLENDRSQSAVAFAKEISSLPPAKAANLCLTVLEQLKAEGNAG